MRTNVALSSEGKRLRLTFAGLALTALCGIALAGCNDKPASDGAPPSAGGPPATGGASAPPAGGAKTIAIISPAKTSEFHQQLPLGAAEEAKKLGWNEIIDQAPGAEDNYTAQVALVKTVLQRKPDAVSICGINPDALNNIVKLCNDAKVPVYVHNQITPVKEGQVVAYIGYDEREGGKLCGQKAAEMLKTKNGDYKGTVAILDGEPSDHTTERAGGFRDALKAYPNIKIVDEQNGKWNREPGSQITQTWLQKYKDLDLVFGCSDAMVQGASEAATKAGHPLFTIGIDGNKTSLEDIKAGGKLTATLAVQPKLIGAKIIDSMKDAFDGKTPPQVVKTDMVIVTKDNVDQFLSK
jgi:ribose transport system substrate-binding protein